MCAPRVGSSLCSQFYKCGRRRGAVRLTDARIQPRILHVAANQPTIYFVVGMYRALACSLALSLLGCSSSRALRRERATLERELETSRIARRDADRRLREERADRLVERERAGALPAAPPTAHPGVSAIGVAHADDVVTIDNAAGDVRVVDILEDGTQIVYVGDAARGTPASLPNQPAVSPSKKGTLKVAVAPPAPIAAAQVPAIPTAAKPAAMVLPPVVTPASAPAPMPAHAWPSGDGDLYQAALAALRSGQHALAIEGFSRLLLQFPASDLADNAQYWIGEAYYDRRQFDDALTAFQTTIARYPKGNKSADATLKVGLCFFNLGQEARGGEYLRRVISLYPASDSARIAGERLAKRQAPPPAPSSPASATSVRSP